MNNRQKAKRFKMLYEEQMKKTVPIRTVFRNELKHYAATYLYSPAGADTFEEELVKKLSEVVKRSVEKEAIDESNVIKYRLDIWVKE